MDNLTRRQFIATLGVGTAALATGCSRMGSTTGAWPVQSPASFQFLHMTDMHVRRRRRGHLGYEACINHVNKLDPQPDFALMGGDLAFDGLYTEKDEFADQIELYKSISAGLNMPYYNCLDNHDMLGWSARRKVPADDPDIGRKMIMDRLPMARPYYSFDHKDWHFVVLDSQYEVQRDHGPTYEPRIGEEQLHWLAYDLGRAGDRPKVVVTHIAAFCHRAQIENDFDTPAMIPGRVLMDTRDLRHVLERHKVKALLQGHTHVNEDFLFNGVWYLTNQSVSAAWWGGNWKGFEPGYAVLTCHQDGELSWFRLSFPWEHHLEPEDTVERELIAEEEEHRARQRALLARERAGV